MNTIANNDPLLPGSNQPIDIRTASGDISHDFIDSILEYLSADDIEGLKDLIKPLHEADVGDVLEAMPSEYRLKFIQLLGSAFDYSALTEVDESVRLELMDAIPNEELARGVAELDSDDAVYLLEDLDDEDRDEILAQMPAFERLSLKRSLDFPEDSAGRRMQTEFVAIPPFWTVGQTIDYCRSQDDLPDNFHQIYVVDASYNVEGVLELDRLLRSQRSVKIADIMESNVRKLLATLDQEEAARTFERYDLLEVPVVDGADRLVGILTIDDIVDVIHEEAGEDIHRLGGVGDEDISGSVKDAVKSRIPWLITSLFTATLASIIIGFFDGTLEQMVSLAILMPIVAAMGGNAGTQTMTVTVRAISMRELDSFNVRRLITREMLVGLINGGVFAVLLGTVTSLRFGDIQLGLVIAAAITINMITAGTFGILVPLTLNRLKVDPALASATFVTMITDIVGFFAFLSIAGLWFGLF